MKRFLLALAILTAVPVPAHAAFKATAVVAEGALTRIRQQAAATRAYLVTQRAAMTTSPVSATVPLAIIQHLATVIPQITTLAATPGLVEYARSQLNDPTYDVVAEFQAMRALMVSTLDNLITMFPKDGSGYLLYQTMNSNGILVTRIFGTAQLAPAVALIDTLIASIE